jgi:hypothetical protein
MPITPMSRDVKYGWSKEETAGKRRMGIAAQLPEETDLRLSEIASRRLAVFSG